MLMMKQTLIIICSQNNKLGIQLIVLLIKTRKKKF